MFLCYYIFIGTFISIARAEAASNQAVSSQSYHRDDVPLSYKNDFIHIYTTPKAHLLNPHEYNQQNTKLQQNYHQIQYAPLPLKNPEQHDQAGRYTEGSGYNHEDDKKSQVHELRTHIEPRVIKTQEPTYVNPRLVPNVPGISGHNLIFQALKNRMLQSGLSTNNHNLLINNNQANIKTLQPQITYKRPEGIQPIPQNTQVSVTEMYPTPNPIYSILPHQYVQSVKKYNEEVSPGKENDPQPTYVKVPKVQLNVARSHNIAHAPQKASVNFNSNVRKPASSQEIFFNKQLLQAPNIKLIPAQKRNILFNHRSV